MQADRRLLLTWAGLVVATLVIWIVGAEHALGGPPAAGSAAGLALGFLKARFVGHTFMELSAAPRALRWTFDAWIVVVATTLVALAASA